MQQKRKAYQKKYYIERRSNVQDPKLKAEYNERYYACNADKLKRVAKTLYALDSNRKKVRAREVYRADPEKGRLPVELPVEFSIEQIPTKRATSRADYQANPNKKRAASRADYQQKESCLEG